MDIYLAEYEKLSVDFSTWAEQLETKMIVHENELEVISTRQTLAKIILSLLKIPKRHEINEKALLGVLTGCKILMRNRQGIDVLLTSEALDLFLNIAEEVSWSSEIHEETLKCVINCIYSRPDFIEKTFGSSHKVIERLLQLSKTRSSSSMFHLLIWKILLVSCESNEVITKLQTHKEAWLLIHSTLSYALDALDFPRGKDRCLLIEDLLKLLYVLAQSMNLQQVASDSFYTFLLPMGKLLVKTLIQRPPTYDTMEIHIKILELFMLFPSSLLEGLLSLNNNKSCFVVALLKHLEMALVYIRVEKTRPSSDLLPMLIILLQLIQMDSTIKDQVKQAIFPFDLPASSISSSTTTTSYSSSTIEQEKNMAPAPVPRDQIFSRPAFLSRHLISYLTCLDTNLKRYTGEFLLELCDQKVQEFTQRTGFGSAIGMLRVKGFV